MKKIRSTSQRQLILDFLRHNPIHPTAEMIYHKVRSTIPHISLGTAYRNLNFMKDRGEIIQLQGPIARYDARVSRHAHFFCEKCKNIIDVIDLSKFKIPAIVNAGRIRTSDIYLRGTCRECLAMNTSA